MRLQKVALYEVVADKLENIILNDISELPQKLPSEQYLADSFGVSRPVVREALKILKERGLVESRQGTPTVITECDAEQVKNTLNRVACTKNILPHDTYQVRAALEFLSVRLAAQNPDEEMLEKLRLINSQIKENKDKIEEYSKLDVEFHNTIAKMSKNPLLEIMCSALFSILEPIIEKTISDVTAQSGISFHDKIITAIKNGDEDRAGELMQAHLALSKRNFEIFIQENRK